MRAAPKRTSTKEQPRVALATAAGWPELAPDDQRGAAALARAGFVPTVVRWDDPRAAWETFAAVVVRSCWDYHRRPGRFYRWLDQLEKGAVPTFNPVPLLRWNADKRYLVELGRAGLPVIATRVLEGGRPPRLLGLMDALGTDEVVVKPVVSASAWRTWPARRATASRDQVRLEKALRGRPLLVQPLVPEIRSRGEWSLIFFGGSFSHAVCKRPGSGDFRTQEELGGTATLASPPAALLATARRVMARLAPTLYARVDLVETGRWGLLMELELIEPQLFFGLCPAAGGRFARALAEQLGGA